MRDGITQNMVILMHRGAFGAALGWVVFGSRHGLNFT